ncbi:cache domain-containing protein, partial [Lysinibacillus sp. NPDC095746]|uniref:HAMP domain-containing protein n=1 Tax=Lysinibacillus sp. NPDC095746 TaxID=3364134 RepID=UPI0038119340
MKRLFGSFKGKLYTLFALILLIPVISVGSLSYLSAKNSIREEILFSADESVKILNTLIDSSISAKINEITSFSEEIDSSKYEQNETTILPNFQEYMKLSPDILSIYIGTNDGEVFVEPKSNSADYNPLERDWYKEATALKGETLITSPYKDVATGEMIVTIARQVKDQSGVVAIDLKLTDLQKVSDSIKIGKNGYPSIFGENNLVISHPTLEPGGQLKESFLDKIYEGKSGTFEYVFDGDDRIMFFTTNELTNWKITGTIFAKEIDQSASSILYKTFLVLIAAIVISGIVFFFVMKAIIKPIKALKDSAVTISKGDLTEKVTVKSH